MKIRFFIMISLLLPIVMLFGLEGYLGKYDQHSKYISQLKDTLFRYSESSDYKSLTSVVDNIDKGNFSEAAACLRAGRAGGAICSFSQAGSTFMNITNIDILKGGYKDSVDDYIKDFRENIIKKREGFVREPIFDFDYNFISNSDIYSWTNYNHKITSERYAYFRRTQIGLSQNKEIYVNGGGVFQPIITYSNVKTKYEGRFRILVLSDSFGAGAGLMSMDETWARELERQLNQIEDRYEIVTLTQGGAGYKDFLRWVEDGYVKEIDPDLVLISYFRNDFNLLHDFNKSIFSKDEGIGLNDLDKELVFYLQCFEKADDLFGRGLKKVNKFFPSIYRYYKFSSCSEELSKVDSSYLIDKVGVVSSYKRVDTLIDVPTFLYQIESKLGLSDTDVKREILINIEENGLDIVNKTDIMGSINNNDCLDIFIYGYQNCDLFKANIYDMHFNRYYNMIHIGGKINVIKKIVDVSLINNLPGEPNKYIPNKSEAIIVDYLPNTLFVSNTSKSSSYVGFFHGKSYGYGRSSENFCVPFDRKGVVLNFNRYLTEGKEIKISSEFQGSGLGLVSRGYDEQGKVIYGKAFELKPGSSVSFIGSESVRGVVLLSNNKNCSSKDIDINDEFLLEVEVL